MIKRLKISSSKGWMNRLTFGPSKARMIFFWKKTERMLLCVFFRFNGMLVRLNMRFFKFPGKSPVQSRKSPPNISRTLHTRHTAKWRLRQLHDEQSHFGRESYHINNPAVSVSVLKAFLSVDGSKNPAKSPVDMVNIPFTRFCLCIPGGAGFLPSQYGMYKLGGGFKRC